MRPELISSGKVLDLPGAGPDVLASMRPELISSGKLQGASGALMR